MEDEQDQQGLAQKTSHAQKTNYRATLVLAYQTHKGLWM